MGESFPFSSVVTVCINTLIRGLVRPPSPVATNECDVASDETYHDDDDDDEDTGP